MEPVPVAAQRNEVPPHHVRELIESHGCRIALRRIEGLDVSEIYLHCRPPTGTADPHGQAEAIYRALVDVLKAEGGSFGSVVAETVFLRNLPASIETVREARHRVLTARAATSHRPATTEIEQPPLNEHACLEVSVQAVLSGSVRTRSESVAARPACGCGECLKAHGLRILVGEETRFHAAGLCGPGENAYQQTLGMFALAESLLQQAGLDFHDVVRTWIHIRDIDRDYGDFNRARREFFREREIDPVPASTGIGGGPVSAAHHLCLGLYASRAQRPLLRTVMKSPTLNEAGQYGADFVRGMKVEESNKIALYVSGTASIDEHGRTAHPGDFDAQAERMIVNIAALLAGQGAGVKDVVSAITYLKHPADADRLRSRLESAGFKGFPHALVEAPICRPDLLCETEALAVVPES